MKQKTLLLCVVVALMLSVFITDTAPVTAKGPKPPVTPATSAWIVSEEEAIEGIIPQFQLEAPTGGYALLQSDAVMVSGYTRICHPYRGGQFGWTSEIRSLTLAGWVGVPTTSGWEPDEEGQYMTCANVGSGTYAVFGYWDRPVWWDMCRPDGYSGPIMDVRDIVLYWDLDGPVYGERCGENGSMIFSDGTEWDLSDFVYCCNYKLYINDDPSRFP